MAAQGEIEMADQVRFNVGDSGVAKPIELFVEEDGVTSGPLSQEVFQEWIKEHTKPGSVGDGAIGADDIHVPADQAGPLVPEYIINGILNSKDNDMATKSRYVLTPFKDQDLATRSAEENAIAKLYGINPAAVPVMNYNYDRATGAFTVQASKGEAERRSYTAENKRTLPGKLLLQESSTEPSNNPTVNKAHQYGGEFRDFMKLLGRNSIDGAGMDLQQTANYDKNYNNAFWNSRQMVYGDGDGKLFVGFVSRDVVGHEMSHGITEHSSGLDYYKESGAINESFSDCMGIAYKQWKLEQSPTADRSVWIIGEKGEVLGSDIKGDGLRNMMYPGTAYNDSRLGGKDPQPDNYKDRYQGGSDNGGVHINSGIMNRAFALACKEIDELGEGKTWDKPIKVLLAVNETRAKHDTNMKQWANMAVQVAQEKYGDKVAQAFKKAYTTVGVLDASKVEDEKPAPLPSTDPLESKVKDGKKAA
jgi:hypothetical protein